MTPQYYVNTFFEGDSSSCNFKSFNTALHYKTMNSPKNRLSINIIHTVVYIFVNFLSNKANLGEQIKPFQNTLNCHLGKTI